MKIITYVIASLWLITMMTGCEKELKDYDGQEGVYFYVQWGAAHGDSTKWANQKFTPVQFINIVGNSHEMKLRVMTTGQVKDYNRTFRIVVDRDSTTAVEGDEYESFDEEQVVEAGAYYKDVYIKLLRSDNISEKQRNLCLRLLPTTDFTISIPEWKKLSDKWSSEEVGEGEGFDASLHTIRLTDFIVKPSRWIGGIKDKPGDAEGGLWGVFTEKKYRLICDKFNLVYEDFMSEEKMPSAKQTVIKEYMAKYLQELYDAKTPVLEDDGRLMWFSGVSWTSIVGTPWVPDK